VDRGRRVIAAGLIERVQVRHVTQAEPRVWFTLHAGDAPLVASGDRVEVDGPIASRLRHPAVAEVPFHGAAEPEPGARFEAGEPLAGEGRAASRFETGGRVLYRTPSGRLRAVVSRHQENVVSPVAGTVESVEPGSICLRADGLGLPGVLGVGEPAHGPLVVAVDGPDAELRPSRIDVRGAGAVLLSGARVDVETVTRARAMGVRGMIAGGIIDKDLRDLAASRARQEAALHASPPFALVVLDGHGKRPIPDALWRLLVAAAGRDVALGTDPPTVILPDDLAVPLPKPGRVRVTGGEAAGRTGRLLAPAGLRRRAQGVTMECALVELEPRDPVGEPEVVELPLADLQRDV
jgi:hypothetical protein